MERYSWDGQMALAEEMVTPWRSVLQEIGVNATVTVYTGSLSSVGKTYSREGEISLVMRAQKNLPVMGFLRRPIVERHS